MRPHPQFRPFVDVDRHARRTDEPAGPEVVLADGQNRARQAVRRRLQNTTGNKWQPLMFVSDM